MTLKHSILRYSNCGLLRLQFESDHSDPLENLKQKEHVPTGVG